MSQLDRHFAITTHDAILYKGFIEVFSSHRQLVSYETNIREAARYLLSRIPRSHAIAFLVLTHRGLITGRFALIHNHQIDLYVRSGNYESICHLAMKGKDSFVELYEGLLSPAEFIIADRLFRNEYEIVQGILESSQEYRSISREYPTYRQIYSQLKENASYMLKNHDRQVEVTESNIRYYFDVVELVCELSDNLPPDHPIVKKLSPEKIVELQNAFIIEIKLVRRYCIWLNNQ